MTSHEMSLQFRETEAVCRYIFYMSVNDLPARLCLCGHISPWAARYGRRHPPRQLWLKYQPLRPVCFAGLAVEIGRAIPTNAGFQCALPPALRQGSIGPKLHLSSSNRW